MFIGLPGPLGEGIQFLQFLLESHRCGQSNRAHTVPWGRERSDQRKYGKRLSRFQDGRQTHLQFHPPLNPSNARYICANCPNWSNLACQSWSTTRGSTKSNTRQPVCLVVRWIPPVSFTSGSTTAQADHDRVGQFRREFSACQPLWKRTQHGSPLGVRLQRHHRYSCSGE